MSAPHPDDVRRPPTWSGPRLALHEVILKPWPEAPGWHRVEVAFLFEGVKCRLSADGPRDVACARIRQAFERLTGLSFVFVAGELGYPRLSFLPPEAGP